MRTLYPVALELDLRPGTYALRTPSLVGDVPRYPTRGDVAWELAGPTHTSPEVPGGWRGATDSDVWSARVTLPLDATGAVITDAAFDVGVNGYRIADAPPLRAAGLRAWYALELAHDEPTDTEILYRLQAGGVDYWVDGGAWAVATLPAEWSTRAKVQAAFTSFPVADRDLVIRARLSSSSSSARPAFYGARVAFGLRARGDDDDALFRSLLPSLRAGAVAVAVAKVRTAAGSGAGPFELVTETPHDVQGVSCVFDLTADPDELVELPGAFAAGPPATWKPTTPIPDGRDVLFEFTFAPLVVLHQHRDLVQVKSVPAVLVAPTGAPLRLASQDDLVIRNLELDPPTATGMRAPDLIEQALEVSVVAELGADVRRICRSIRSWMKGGGIPIVSPESGQIVHVREQSPFTTTTGTLALGVHEARAGWILTYPSASALTLGAVHLARADGVLVDVQEG